MDNHIKLTTFIAILIAIFLVCTSQVIALGVSSPYWKDNPLKMYPGQTKEVSFALVNSEQDSAKAYVSLLEGSDIARIISGDQYTVPYGTTNNKVILSITIPQTVSPGTTYNVAFSIKSAPHTQEGTIQLGVGYKVDFPIIIAAESDIPPEPTPTPIQQENEFNWTIAIALVLVIILAVVITLVIIKKRKQI